MAELPSIESYELYKRNWDDYDELYEEFEWVDPEWFNIAAFACDRWAEDKERVALIDHTDDGREYTHSEIQDAANRLANYLQSQGVEKGDPVAISAPQKPEVLITHIAVWKLGAVTVPLNTLFGPDAVKYRLSDTGADVFVVDKELHERIGGIASDLNLDLILNIDAEDSAFDDIDFWTALEPQSPDFETVKTDPDDDAMIIYTSGTTGKPKGGVHGHRVILGTLSVYNVFNLNMKRAVDDVFYSVASWGWVTSTYMLWTELVDGMPVVANTGQFDPAEEFRILESYDVTSYFNAPTGLRAMMQVDTEQFDLDSVRVVCSGGEEVTQAIYDWVDEAFSGAVATQALGQTECPAIVAFCPSLMEFKPGRLGKPIPGLTVDIVDPETGEPLAEPDSIGEIAIRYEEAPITFKRYQNMPEKTDSIRKNGWQLTGDLGRKQADGNFIYESRKDDVIISAGYRIGPGEIEESLANHEAVVDCGVIGVPDSERGEVPKAFVILADGFESSTGLKGELEQHVRDQLARYESPREIEYIEELPKTATGKLRRKDLRDREGLLEE